LQAGSADVAGDPKEGQPADMAGAGRTGRRAIAPVVTIKDGRAYEPSAGAHPWGLAPPVAD